MLASLPSITEVGMPALLCQNSYNLESINGQIKVFLDGKIISGKEDRENYLKDKYKEDITFLNLNELSQELSLLSEQLSEAIIVVVSDLEIDKAGRFLSENILEHFDKLLEIIEKGVETVTLLGFQKIIITTDHGFLIIPDPQGIENIEGFSEQGLVVSRRYALGKPPRCNDCISLPLKNIGYEGEGEILLPKGIKYLPRKGPKEIYIHGGLSLQECCIGVLEIKPKIVGKRVNVRAEISEPISSKFVRVKMIPQTTELFPIPRNVKTQLIHKGKVVGESEPVELLRQASEIYMKLEETKDVKSVELRLIDVLTKEIIFSKYIEVTIGDYDDLF
jgi:hypothetical protein